MRTVVKARVILLAGLAVIGSMLITQPRDAEARPGHRKIFEKEYPKVNIKKVKCNVCHEGKSKKKRNVYGKALGKLMKKNEKDKKKVVEALKKVEKEKSAIKDKTFGDLLKAGKLPASKK